MVTEELEKLKYPIGKFNPPENVDQEHIKNWIKELENFPEELAALVTPFNNNQLDTPYRPEGWTVRQVVHHLADSHHHCYTRFKWALTEDEPLIKAYEEKTWALLADQSGPIELSINYLRALHKKIVYLIKILDDQDLERGFIHPAHGKRVELNVLVGMYAWHGQHHMAHIKNLAQRSGWL